MPIYLGPNQVTGLWLGTREITRVWKGADLVYQKGAPPGPAEYTLFDNGWVSGVSWSGNLLPRPVYTSLGQYSFSLVDSNGLMNLSIDTDPDYSHVTHNCHVCTTDPIVVPAGATKMCVEVSRANDSYLHTKWGLVDPDAANATVPGTHGQLSEWTALAYGSTKVTLQQTLASGVAGQQLRAIVNMRAYADGFDGSYYNDDASLNIYKFWFE